LPEARAVLVGVAKLLWVGNASVGDADSFLDHLTRLLQRRLGGYAGLLLSLGERLFLTLELLANAEQVGLQGGVVLGCGQLQGRVDVGLEAFGHSRGGRLARCGQSRHLVDAMLRELQESFHAGRGVGGEGQSNVFAQGFDPVERLVGQVVLRGVDSKTSTGDQGYGDEDCE
jgi:hypothetical protein